MSLLAFVFVVIVAAFGVTRVAAVAAIALAITRSVGRRGPCGAASAQVLNQLRGHLLKEARGNAHLRCVIAIAAAIVRARKNQRVHGARHADVAEPALFFELFRIVEGARMWKQALFESGKKDERK